MWDFYFICFVAFDYCWVLYHWLGFHGRDYSHSNWTGGLHVCLWCDFRLSDLALYCLNLLTFLHYHCHLCNVDIRFSGYYSFPDIKKHAAGSKPSLFIFVFLHLDNFVVCRKSENFDRDKGKNRALNSWIVQEYETVWFWKCSQSIVNVSKKRSVCQEISQQVTKHFPLTIKQRHFAFKLAQRGTSSVKSSRNSSLSFK